MPRTLIRDGQIEDIAVISEAELNEFFEAVVITGTENATGLIQTFAEYFPGQGLVQAGGGLTVITGSNFVVVSGTDTISDALVGADGITVISGADTTTVSGFYTEVVSASGSLQSQIDAVEAGDVDAINAETGAITVTGTSGVQSVTTANTITLSAVESEIDHDQLSNFESNEHFTEASIDHTAIQNVGDNTHAEIDTHLGALAASGVATDAQVVTNRTEFVATSGSLQTQIDAVEAGDVDGVNAVTGQVTITGAGTVSTITEGQTITVSGSGGGALDQAFTAGQTIAIRDAVALDGSGNVIPARADVVDTVEAIGFATSAASTGQTVTVRHQNNLEGFAGLTPGEPQFLSTTTSGAITETPPSAEGDYILQVGLAVSTSVVYVNVDSAIAHKITAESPPVELLNALSGTVTITGAGTVETITEGQVITVSGSGGGGGDAGTLDQDFTAGQNLSAGDVVALNSSGNIIPAIASSVDTIEAIGCVTSTVSTGQTAAVRHQGNLDVFSGLTAGEPLFLSPTISGAVSGTPPSTEGTFILQVGQAVSSTEIYVNVDSASSLKNTSESVPVQFLNALSGTVTVTGAGTVDTITEGQTITISGTATLQDAYDNGTGIITTAGGKPFELQGTGELTAVTGTFTEGLTVGTGTLVLTEQDVLIGATDRAAKMSDLVKGATAANTVVYKPGGVDEGNVYSTWSSALTALEPVAGPKIVFVDDSIQSPALVPSGTYDLTNTKLEGNSSTLVFTSKVQFEDGATLSALDGFLDLAVTTNSTTPVAAISGTTSFQIISSSVQTLSGSAPFFQVQDYAVAIIALSFNSEFLTGPGNDSVLQNLNTTPMTILALDAFSHLNDDTLEDVEGAAPIQVHEDASGVISDQQAGLNTPPVVIHIDNSASVFYTGVLSVDNVHDAIDYLTITGTSNETVVAVSGHLQTEIDNIDSSVTLQDAYDNGDGSITTAFSKPLDLQGTGELTAVSGTFTNRLFVGTNVQISAPGAGETATVQLLDESSVEKGFLEITTPQRYLRLGAPSRIEIWSTGEDVHIYAENNVSIGAFTGYAELAADDGPVYIYATEGIKVAGSDLELKDSSGDSISLAFKDNLNALKGHIRFTDDVGDGSLDVFAKGPLTITGSAGVSIDTGTDFGVNTDALFVQGSTGRVGIGTTSPAKLLELSNTGGSAALQLTGSGANVIHSVANGYDINYTRSSGIPIIDFRALPGDGTSAAQYRFGLASGSTGANQIILFEPNGTDIQTWIQTSAGSTYFNAQGGNVGIGTTTPSEALDVVGSGIFSGDITSSNGDITASGVITADSGEFTTGLTVSGEAVVTGTIFERRHFGFSIDDELRVEDDASLHVIMPFGGTIIKGWAAVKTGPTGAALNLQVYNVTQAVDVFSGALAVSDGSTTGTSTSIGNATVTEDDVFRLDIDQVGSTVPGSGIVVQLAVNVTDIP